MKKICLSTKVCLFAITLIISTLFLTKAFAANLTLDYIGAFSTDGKVYSDWWYTQSNPTLKGKATANSQVAVNTNGQISNVTADASGDWSYGSSLAEGDHAVSISSGGETLSFNLHLGPNLPDTFISTTTTTSTTLQSTVSVPDTGSSGMLVLSLSLLTALLGWYFYEQRSPKQVFEEAVVKD